MSDSQDDTIAELEAFLAEHSDSAEEPSEKELDFDEMLKNALRVSTEELPEPEADSDWLTAQLEATEKESSEAIMEVYGDEAVARTPEQIIAAQPKALDASAQNSLADAVEAALRSATRPAVAAVSTPSEGPPRQKTPRAQQRHAAKRPHDRERQEGAAPPSAADVPPAPRAEPESKKVQELREQVKRFSAETDRFRERVQDQAKKARSTGRKDVFDRLLPIIDTLELALRVASGAKSTEKLIAGVEMVFKQLLTELEHLGLKSVDSEGMEFDPMLHEAMQKVRTGEVEAGHVNQVIRRGFTFEEKLVRAAQVIVEE